MGSKKHLKVENADLVVRVRDLADRNLDLRRERDRLRGYLRDASKRAIDTHNASGVINQGRRAAMESLVKIGEIIVERSERRAAHDPLYRLFIDHLRGTGLARPVYINYESDIEHAIEIAEEFGWTRGQDGHPICLGSNGDSDFGIAG